MKKFILPSAVAIILALSFTSCKESTSTCVCKDHHGNTTYSQSMAGVSDAKTKCEALSDPLTETTCSLQ